MSTDVVIGGDSIFAKNLEQGLIDVGVAAAETSLAASQPWTNLPIVHWLVDNGIQFGISAVAQEADNIIYTIYVSVKDSIQAQQYIQAQSSGNQSNIDAVGDAIIGLGNE
jgi:hypothetical protein